MAKTPHATRPWWLPEKKKDSWSKSPNYKTYNAKSYRKKVRLHKIANPLCVECLKDGIRTPVEVTDHIVPIRDGGAVHDPNNWQSLCNRHHIIKTNGETAARKANRGT